LAKIAENNDHDIDPRLLATGVIPFVLLALLNSKIFLAIRRSKHQLRSLAIR
jgi:hypothetical protein